MTEKQYIQYRKLKAATNRLCFYICRIFPIHKKLISVCTFEGKGGFGCNPKYLVEALHRKDPTLKFVWFLNENAWDKEFPPYIKKVKNSLWSRAYWLSRSKVWIDNYRKPYGTAKRPGQYYLNTNHYTLGIKTVGLWRGKGFSPIAYMVSKNDSDMIDDLIIDSKFGEVVTPRGMIYEGSYLNIGAPRCDVLYGDLSALRKTYRKANNLPEDAKILLFAPTFREGARDGKRFVYSQEWSLDFGKLLETLESKFGGPWYICFRVHPQLAASFKDYEDDALKGRILNESQADDLYEIMAAMDAYITDYSSACFEAAFANIPVFLYADDINKYEKDRGSLYWNLTDDSRRAIPANKDILEGWNVALPFPLARTNEELLEDIKDFNRESYEEGLSNFWDYIDLHFTGHASDDAAGKVLEQMGLVR